MKKFLTLFALIVLTGISKSFATDIVVEEFGLSPAYPTITDAVNAAADGDRIIIKNRAGNIPWIENITITKSLEFLPFENDTFFVVQGNYSINLTTGKTVSIIGMKNTSGSIVYGGGASGLKTSTLNIYGCYFLSGYVDIGTSAYTVNIVHTQFDAGNIHAYFGSVIGCDIHCSSNRAILFNSGSGGGNDTIAIIGNNINMLTSSYEAIYVNSTTSRLHIRNNMIRHRNMGIYLYGLGSGYNLIYNNTIQAYSTSSTTYGIYINNIQTAAICEVMNNLIDYTSTGNTYGIYNGGGNLGTTNVYYNHVETAMTTPILTGWTFSGNNTTTSVVTLQSDLRPAVGSAAVDNGNPAAPYYDLDLSIGDPGAYGGSYTIDNFFPIHYGAARVFLSTYPFNVRQGNTLNIKATSYDR